MDVDVSLDNESVARYSRQLIMPEIGVKGQIKLNRSKVLIVGAGGLGCPAAQYLAAAGVGTIGIVDYDEVEISNLHRQILHTEKRAAEKWTKAESVSYALRELNSSCNVIPIITQLDQSNAVKIFEDYDVVIDATDNVPSRYLISDVCVLSNKPLVSGSALRWEGQLTVYHYTDKDGCTGPCYRCIHPVPPPPESVTNCSDGGVIGVVPGIIGCMQALETMKILTSLEPSYHQKLYLFDGLRGNCRTIKLRPQQKSCIACGENPNIGRDSLPDYTAFCGMGANDKCRIVNILNQEERITVKQYHELLQRKEKHILVDVRQPVELDICSLPNCFNIPIQNLKSMEACHNNSTKNQRALPELNQIRTLAVKYFNDLLEALKENIDPDKNPLPVYVLCRMGNDSQIAVKILKKYFSSDPVVIKDIKGGLMAWANQIDTSMAQY